MMEIYVDLMKNNLYQRRTNHKEDLNFEMRKPYPN